MRYLLRLYGLERPFNFKVAITFLSNACALIIVLFVCVFLFFAGDLNIGTVRFYFFTYIACLLLFAAAISKASKISLVILCWCVIELSLALFMDDLRPPNFVFRVNPNAYAFIYHPLLQLVPRPNWTYMNQPRLRGHEAEAKAGGIDIASVLSRKLRFSHNSLGLRGKELTPEDLTKDLIFVYGGSTTYDIGVSQGETWVEELQSALNNKYTVVNFGVVGHSTAEHLIYTSFYQRIIPKRPACAIYYEGWNDVINSYLPSLDGAYANYHSLTMAVRTPDLSIAKYSPLVLLLNDTAKRRFDTVPEIPSILGRPTGSGCDKRLEAIYIEHIKTLAAINSERGIKTIFIGQMINKDYPKGRDIFAPLVKAGDFPPLIARFNSIMKSTAASIPAKYIDAGVSNFVHTDFVDFAHFSPTGTRKFAALISKDVDSYCQ